MSKRLALVATLVIGGLALLVALAAMPAAAAPAGTTYYVGPGGSNANPCTSPGAPCLTIGGALGKAAASGDTIMVAAGTYHEHLTIAKSVTINGASASNTIVDGSSTDRVITVTTGSNVVLSQLTINNGKAAIDGGGIFNDGTLALDNSVVTTNTAAFYGGGIYSDHYLTLTNSSVLTNTATNGGGIYNYGPLFATPAHATLDNSVVRGNTVISDGGGLYNDGFSVGSARLTLQNNSIVISNTAVGGSGAGIYNNRALTLTNTVLQFNSSGGTNAGAGGGGLYNGSSGALVLAGVNVAFNSATNLGGGLDNIGTATGTDLFAAGNIVSGTIFGSGGGLSNEGHLSLDHSTIAGNTFGPKGGGGAGLVDRYGWMTITTSSISHNSAGIGLGGGAFNLLGILTVEDSTFSDNSGASGGGLFSQGGKTFVVDSTISGNRATGSGGAIYSYELPSSLIMTNTTVSGNQAGGSGGGIVSFQRTYLNNVTVAFNVAVGFDGGLSVPITSTPVLTALNSIIADNLSGSAADCYGSVASLGYNLIGNDHGCDFHPFGGTDLVGTANNPIDPLLDGLALNGNPNGPWTDALFVGSPAIDHGNDAACATTDERGVARPVGPHCDMGAFEGAVALFRVYLPLVRR